MKRTETNGNVNISFNSIADVVNYIDTTERTLFYQKYHVSDNNDYRFTGTHTMEEAMELLFHGWEDGAKQLKSKLDAKVNVNNNGYRNKKFYDIAGFQCSVPRYLQGIPTNMINNKRVVQKQKVVNITKDFGYSGATSTQTMMRESVKFLQAVDKLEKQGVRCNVFVSVVTRSRKSKGYIDIRVKVKDSSQRMNLKQLAFPLAHPSMFRRIELNLAKGNTELVDFIEELRTQARTNGIRATFSYRCIIAVTKLERAGIDINTLLEIAVFKGLGADTINTFNKYTLSSNKYMKVFREEFKVA